MIPALILGALAVLPGYFIVADLRADQLAARTRPLTGLPELGWADWVDRELRVATGILRERFAEANPYHLHLGGFAPERPWYTALAIHNGLRIDGGAHGGAEIAAWARHTWSQAYAAVLLEPEQLATVIHIGRPPRDLERVA